MESLSNTLPSASARIKDFEYLYASNTNVSNFVSVKLSGNNYHLWKTQMVCLFGSKNMLSVVNPTFVGPSNYDTDTAEQYDFLARGWILGSISEDILEDVHDLGSAKAIWEKLESIYDPPSGSQEDSTSKKPDTVEEDQNSIEITADNVTPRQRISEGKSQDSTSTKPDIVEEDPNSIEITADNVTPRQRTSEGKSRDKDNENKNKDKKELRKFTIKGDWSNVETILKKYEGIATEAISNDGSTILHLAVGIGQNVFVEKLLSYYISDKQVLQNRDTDGSTPLHIAAIVGNKHLAEVLVEKNQKLLVTEDNDHKVPLQKAFKNMHLDTIGYLLKAMKDNKKIEAISSSADSIQSGDKDVVKDFLINAISAKHYRLAIEVMKDFSRSASKSDDVLMAIAKTFPSGLDSWEALVYPSLANILELLSGTFVLTVYLLGCPGIAIWSTACLIYEGEVKTDVAWVIGTFIGIVIFTVLAWLALPFVFVFLNILVVCVVFLFLYSIWWKAATLLFTPIKHIDEKKKEWDVATKVLDLVCDEIDKLDYSGTHHDYYTRPLLEAACHNAYKVVDEILIRSPEAIQSEDKNGYDIIHLAIINRSEKIYNLIYDIGERKILYRIYKDSSRNNILHLASRLAPSSVLNEITGAALQLQRELQWHEEVKKFVFPTYITEENEEGKIPDMVFRTEHETLVKEGEKWMKTTAESCSITAALITTIVFAAAITVPGGNDDKEGTPLFRKRTAFIIFAVSDAISLFASSTALLVFLSILTARFAEKDFLVSLPRRLFIGLFSLLLSTTTMMIAFSATLFLVFGNKKQWVLGPICGLALIPIVLFVGLQFPLMVDLFSSTSIGIFGKQRKGINRRFDPDDIRLDFGTNIEGNIRRAAKREKKRNDEHDMQLVAQTEGQTKKYEQLEP